MQGNLEDDEEEDDEGEKALPGDTLCRACTSNAECGSSNYCLRRSDGVSFCGRDCRSSACPSGYTCTRLSWSVSQCVPPQGDCSRVADAGLPDAGFPDAGTPDAGARDASVADPGVSDAAVSDAGAVPGSAHCAPAANWNSAWASFEDEVLRLSNQQRSAGASCGGTRYAPVPALTMNSALRCAARLHSQDMQARNYFSHTTPDGVTFDERISDTGYDWRTVGENIAAGYSSPQAVVTGWMQSPGHCVNIMNPAFKEIGVGFYGNHRWTQDFGTRW